LQELNGHARLREQVLACISRIHDHERKGVQTLLVRD
jgi:hypothetical protein